MASATVVDNRAPPFPPSSSTPVLEKDPEELEFTGNVDVNDDLPSQRDLDRISKLFVLDSKGQSVTFKEVFAGEEGKAGRQLVIFVRHFFCGNCQEYIRHLSSSVSPESLLSLPTPTFITIIGCGSTELIDMYQQATNCPFPIYADPTRKLYDILGMTRTLELGKKPGYIQSNLFITSVQSIVQGIKTGTKATKGGDIKQVGGEFLFEEGKPVWAHRMRNTRDHAEVETIREVLGLKGERPLIRKRWSHGVKEEGEKRRSRSWGRLRSVSRSKKEGRKSLEEKKVEENIPEKKKNSLEKENSAEKEENAAKETTAEKRNSVGKENVEKTAA
ncbi:hypothetical protein M011DRAFT_404575 [Sporormia fimetaria CBS 119925]|uniref:AhpC-TSA-domain-containing protein n=1 Tax=Sporormia fimetaria CBS 119925 TaxID=1340428 RepID=A0A6A6V6Z2_9PLEO|nr:hypothetical protein M011DRAFT_404575 [Sporormia fimetaria CBS 119925]